jgi:hypothetical protein
VPADMPPIEKRTSAGTPATRNTTYFQSTSRGMRATGLAVAYAIGAVSSPKVPRNARACFASSLLGYFGSRRRDLREIEGSRWEIPLWSGILRTPPNDARAGCRSTQVSRDPARRYIRRPTLCLYAPTFRSLMPCFPPERRPLS